MKECDKKLLKQKIGSLEDFLGFLLKGARV